MWFINVPVKLPDLGSFVELLRVVVLPITYMLTYTISGFCGTVCITVSWSCHLVNDTPQGSDLILFNLKIKVRRVQNGQKDGMLAT